MSIISKTQKEKFIKSEALRYHAKEPPGKYKIVATKPMATQADLSLAYSPGVAAPVLEIANNEELAYDYTNKGNMVAIISNGSAILGLGHLSAIASKPVMEGKAVLFKRFADVDAIDLEVDTTKVDEFINCVRYLGSAFGGINLEDIKAPDCFIIEQQLSEKMSIPVFHDDQHGTAIIAVAGLINALELTNRKIEEVKLVCNGAGAAGIACIELVKALGAKHENVILCDTKGVIYKGRQEGMNQWKSAHAAETKARTLKEALDGADAIFGLSVKGAITKEMVKNMADKPIIFAMANPDPEITPEEVKEIRNDAIMATGRSDYPNQINNVLGFPYIFRGALDVRASSINLEMKIAAAQALAKLAREDVPDEVASAYRGQRPKYGSEYIIPAPFDPRLISRIPSAVAMAALDSGVAKKMIVDMDEYEAKLAARLNPILGIMENVFNMVKANPKRVVFAEGEESTVIRAANSFANSGLGKAILVGRERKIEEVISDNGIEISNNIQIYNAGLAEGRNEKYADFLYERLQRRGYLYRDCLRIVNYDRNVFAACMVAMGDADTMVTGKTRSFSTCLDNVRLVIDPKLNQRVIGISIVLGAGGSPIFIADSGVCHQPKAEEIAKIAIETADFVRKFGYEPKVALVAFSNFGQPPSKCCDKMRKAVKILNESQVDFEYDGEMTASVALNKDSRKSYPFCKLSGAANILIMPDYNCSNITTKLLGELGNNTIIGPILYGMEQPVQIATRSATASDLVNLAAIASNQVGILGRHNGVKYGYHGV